MHIAYRYIDRAQVKLYGGVVRVNHLSWNHLGASQRFPVRHGFLTKKYVYVCLTPYIFEKFFNMFSLKRVIEIVDLGNYYVTIAER